MTADSTQFHTTGYVRVRHCATEMPLTHCDPFILSILNICRAADGGYIVRVLGGDTYMTSARRRGRGLPKKQTQVLIYCVSVTVTKGGGQESRTFADVI